MNKTVKRVLIAVLSVAAGIAAIWGILTVVRTARRQPVNVYAVSNFSTSDYWGNASQSSGMVTVENLQKIFLSSTQTVTDVFVQEGQHVSKGDRLLAYDTTLTDLDIEYARIALERQEQGVDRIRDSITGLENLRDLTWWKAELEKVDAQLAKAEAAARAAQGAGKTAPVPSVKNVTEQDGSEAHPLYLRDDKYTLSALNGLLATDTDIHVVIYHSDAEAGDSSVQGIRLSRKDGQITFFAPPEIPTADDAADADTEVRRLRSRRANLDEVINSGSVPETPAEALKQRAKLEKDLKTAEIDLKLAQIAFQKKEREVADSAVYSQQDGVVRAVRDADDAFRNGEPVIEVSGGGGYYVTGAISELDLGNIHSGDTVQITSWMTGTACEGSVVSVDSYPTNQSGWGGGNQNVSYYPFKVFVSEDANLQENDYVNITYQSSGGTDAWYLENMFIRVDNGKSYVYARGADGTLEQRDVVTGRDLWGSYTEIRSGLTQDDYVAFPYGQDVAPGAKTNEATPNELYNG